MEKVFNKEIVVKTPSKIRQKILMSLPKDPTLFLVLIRSSVR